MLHIYECILTISMDKMILVLFHSKREKCKILLAEFKLRIVAVGLLQNVILYQIMKLV